MAINSTVQAGTKRQVHLPLFSFDIKSHIQYARETDKLFQDGRLIWTEYTRNYPEKIFGIFNKVVFKKFGTQKVIDTHEPCHIKLCSGPRGHYAIQDLGILVDWLSGRQDHPDPWEDRDAYCVRQGSWRGRTFILNRKGTLLDVVSVETMVILRLNAEGVLEMCILNVNKINLN